MKLKQLILFLLIFLPFSCFCEAADIKVCFTPGEQCGNEIVNEINHEDKRILVQAYYLTSRPIIGALIKAKERSVDVKVILDKSQIRGKKVSVVSLLNRYAIPVWIDNTVAIAHNKVIIFGGSEVITGSYNFTYSAQAKNAENMLIIKSPEVASQYMDNFKKRLSVSKLVHRG